jgi:flavin-binding protein dodecin
MRRVPRAWVKPSRSPVTTHRSGGSTRGDDDVACRLSLARAQKLNIGNGLELAEICQAAPALITAPSTTSLSQRRKLLAVYAVTAAGPRGRSSREGSMAVATVTKITAASPKSFDEAVKEGFNRASKTLRGISGLRVVDQKASVSGDKIAEYRVTMEITFVLED